MDRGRDRRYDDRDRPVGETYRPTERGGRSPVGRADNYRTPRSPPRRTRSPGIDSYAPRGGRGDGYGRNSPGRRRSRSPAYRGRDSQPGYRARVRTPPRPLSPRRDVRPRSPAATRRYSRSPRNGSSRARSPLPQKRYREPTPPSTYRQRSPPPAKRERYTEPAREDYEKRVNSPPREIPSRIPRDNNQRPRGRSRTPPRRSEQLSRAQSPNSSRRSSPPMHPDRMAMSRSPGYVNTRVERVERVERLVDYQSPRRNHSPPPRSPPHEPSTWRSRSPLPVRERENPRNGVTPNTWSSSQMAPLGNNYRNGDSRPLPTGPDSSRRDNYSREQPSGPPSAPVSMSAHNRPSSTSLLQAPTRPRGGPSFGRDSPRDAPYGGPPHHRGGRHHNGPPPPRQSSYDSHSVNSIPTGPRGANSLNGPSNPAPYDPPPRVPFRPNNSSSTTYPRTQRFHTHLSNLPSVVPGGKAAPSSLDPASEKRLQQLEDDKKKLIDAIEEKQRIKRKGLRDWENAERESKRDMLKSELAEGHLDRLSGEEGMSGSAY